ncbi:hypothetical protein, partial [Streptomyces salinarius]
AVSTVLTWGYYGLKSWTYLFGRSRAGEVTYKVVYTAFAVAGSLLILQTLIGSRNLPRVVSRRARRRRPGQGRPRAPPIIPPLKSWRPRAGDSRSYAR